MQFTEFGLGADLERALEDEGYAVPTPIQAQAIPSVLAGRDLLGIAQTGTGKTAAFALPILARLASNPRETRRGTCRALILSPTRELATQIGDSIRSYGRHTNLSVTVVFGGVSHRPQLDALRRGIDILVATPGRLIDHLDGRNLSLEAVETFVLDEADQMLDLGFVRPIRNIVARLPKVRQNLFFSATMPFEIGALAAELLVDPLKVSVAPAATTVERVTQRVLLIERAKKRSLLAELLGDPAMTRTIVFTRTKRGADRVTRHLDSVGISAAAIHGNKSQPQREKALASFRDGETRVLVATDIAARGIDIEQVSHVINYELPEVPESYVHRIGRTARAGAEGSAIALVDQEERGLLRDIERLTRQQIPSEDRRGDTTLAVVTRDADRPRRQHGSDNRRRSEDREGAANGHADRGARERFGETGARPRHRDRDRNHQGRRGSERRDHAQAGDYAAGKPAQSRDRKPRAEQDRDHRDQHGAGFTKRGERPSQQRDGDRPSSQRPDREHGERHQRPDRDRGDFPRFDSDRNDTRNRQNDRHPAADGHNRLRNGRPQSRDERPAPRENRSDFRGDRRNGSSSPSSGRPRDDHQGRDGQGRSRGEHDRTGAKRPFKPRHRDGLSDERGSRDQGFSDRTRHARSESDRGPDRSAYQNDRPRHGSGRQSGERRHGERHGERSRQQTRGGDHPYRPGRNASRPA